MSKVFWKYESCAYMTNVPLWNEQTLLSKRVEFQLPNPSSYGLHIKSSLRLYREISLKILLFESM